MQLIQLGAHEISWTQFSIDPKLSAMKIIALMILSLLVGCSGGAIKRSYPEHEKLRVFKIGPEDEFFSAKVLAAEEPLIASQEGYYAISIPLAKDKLQNCFLHKIQIHPGQAAYAINQELKVKSGQTKVYQVPMLTHTQMENRAKHSIFMGEAISFHKEKKNNFTPLKYVAASFPGGTLLCYINFPKSYNSLYELMTNFVDSIDFKDPAPKEAGDVKLEQVYHLKNKKKTVGVIRSQLLYDKDKYVAKSTLSAYGPGNPFDLLATDVVTHEVSDSNHELLNGKYLFIRNKVAVHFLWIKKINRLNYKVWGEYYGKPFERMIKVTEPLTHHLFAFVKMYRASELENLKISTYQYHPQTLLGKEFYVQYDYSGKVEGQGDRISGTIENVQMHMFLKEERIETVETQTQGAKLRYELVHLLNNLL